MELTALIVSGVLGLAGVVVGGLGVVLTFRERVASHRQAIYEKQIEAYYAVLSALWRFYMKMCELLPNDGIIKDQAAKNKVILLLTPEALAVVEVWRDSMLFCPQGLAEKFDDAFTRWEDVLDTSKLPVSNGSLIAATHNAVWEAVAYARKELGVDQLRLEVFKTIGIRPNEDYS